MSRARRTIVRPARLSGYLLAGEDAAMETAPERRPWEGSEESLEALLDVVEFSVLLEF